MKTRTMLALGTALLIGGISLASPAAAQRRAQAQQGQQAQPAAAPERKFDLSKEARAPLAALQKAVEGGDDATVQAAVAAAQAAATTPDDKYVLSQFQLRHAIAKNNDAGKIAALEAMIQSGGATQQEMPVLYENLGGLYYNAKQIDQATDAFAKQVELAPNDAEAVIRLAQLRSQQKRYPESVQMFQRAIDANKAAGQPVPEDTYQMALRSAYLGKMAPETAALSRELVKAYPTADNWRDALVIFRETHQLDKGTDLDVMRLQRAAKSLKGEAEWFELADLANDAGLPGEAKAVLDEGAASRAIDLSKPNFKDLAAIATNKTKDDRTSLAGLEKQAASAANGRAAANTANAYLGYGDYAKAAALYRTALEKGQVDADQVNTRLGIALAMAGQRAEAEAALKAVKGPRTEVANYWLLWLEQRG